MRWNDSHSSPDNDSYTLTKFQLVSISIIDKGKQSEGVETTAKMSTKTGHDFCIILKIIFNCTDRTESKRRSSAYLP